MVERIPRAKQQRFGGDALFCPDHFEVIDWLKSKNSSIHISIYDDPNPNTSEHKYSCVLYYGYLKSENETTFKYRKVFNGDTAENVLNDAILELVEYFKK